jgi:hypothetical protein
VQANNETAAGRIKIAEQSGLQPLKNFCCALLAKMIIVRRSHETKTALGVVGGSRE